jgi:hypothetical protein
MPIHMRDFRKVYMIVVLEGDGDTVPYREVRYFYDDDNDRFLGKHDPGQEFKECPTCAAKPGSPTLCGSCLHNRAVISELTRAV